MELISLKDAARRLGIEPGTLRKWVQARRIAFYRIGAHPKFSAADLDRFIESKRVPAVQRIKDFRPRVKHGAA